MICFILSFWINLSVSLLIRVMKDGIFTTFWISRGRCLEFFCVSF